MSALDWLKLAEGPAGVIAGVVGTKVFQRARERQDLALSESHEAKIDAEAAEIIARAAAALVIPLEQQIKALTKRVDAYVEYIQELHVWIAVRTTEIPPPPPIVREQVA